jgi:hypothetical protein
MELIIIKLACKAGFTVKSWGRNLDKSPTFKYTFHSTHLRANFGKYEPHSTFTSHILKIQSTFPFIKQLVEKSLGQDG